MAYCWKALDKGYNFSLELIAIGGLNTKLCSPKLWNPNNGNFETPIWESQDEKSHLDVALVEKRRVYYKREGGGLPQVWAVVSLVNLNCPWLILAPKVLQLCTNHLVLVLCRSM